MCKKNGTPKSTKKSQSNNTTSASTGGQASSPFVFYMDYEGDSSDNFDIFPTFEAAIECVRGMFTKMHGSAEMGDEAARFFSLYRDDMKSGQILEFKTGAMTPDRRPVWMGIHGVPQAGATQRACIITSGAPDAFSQPSVGYCFQLLARFDSGIAEMVRGAIEGKFEAVVSHDF